MAGSSKLHVEDGKELATMTNYRDIALPVHVPDSKSVFAQDAAQCQQATQWFPALTCLGPPGVPTSVTNTGIIVTIETRLGAAHFG